MTVTIWEHCHSNGYLHGNMRIEKSGSVKRPRNGWYGRSSFFLVITLGTNSMVRLTNLCRHVIGYRGAYILMGYIYSVTWFTYSYVTSYRMDNASIGGLDPIAGSSTCRDLRSVIGCNYKNSGSFTTVKTEGRRRPRSTGNGMESRRLSSCWSRLAIYLGYIYIALAGVGNTCIDWILRIFINTPSHRPRSSTPHKSRLVRGMVKTSVRNYATKSDKAARARKGASSMAKKARAFNSKEGGTRWSFSSIGSSLISQIGNIFTLKCAYAKIKRYPGNITPGTDGITLDGMTEKYLEKASADILAGKYRFSPARRVMIPKGKGDEIRPLDIGSPREKIIQTAMLIVLTERFEPKFSESRHGFRPGRSPHTALKQISIERACT